MDKLQRWLERIQRAPKQEVANLDHWDLLLEMRVVMGTVLLTTKSCQQDRPHDNLISKTR